jgi:hypothetical protein
MCSRTEFAVAECVKTGVAWCVAGQNLLQGKVGRSRAVGEVEAAAASVERWGWAEPQNSSKFGQTLGTDAT